MRIAYSPPLLAICISASWTISPTPTESIYPPNGYNLPVTAPASNSTYDYIVVGSGPGGAPVAARLALAGYSVLVLEAGEDHGTDRQVQVPALHPYASEYNPIRWDYYVEHYTDPTQARRDSKMTYLTPDGNYYVGLDPPGGSDMLGIYYPRTAALGGCSQHNALITILPTEADWNYIANVTEDGTWKASNMRRYFEKLEACRYLPNSVVGHGFTGWLQTRLTPAILILEDLKVLSLVIAAATAMGQHLVGKVIDTVAGLLEVLTLDVNNPSPTRDHAELIYQIPLSMTADYARSSPRDLLLSVHNATSPDGSRRYKLDIALNTLATKINFDTPPSSKNRTTPRATGVSYLHGRHLYHADPFATPGTQSTAISGTIFARKEVILSAGAFNTPQLLKISGVGPRSELERFSIPVVVDLPGVGGNMQDRYEVGIVGKAPTPFSLLEDCTFLNGTDPCYNQWRSEEIGYLKGGYTTNGIAFGFLHHSSAADPTGDPDLFLGGVPAYFNGYFPGYSVHATEDLSIWTWLTLKAHSRNNAGSVNLTSASPLDTPRITFHSFGEDADVTGGEQDLQAVYEGMQYGIRAFEDLVPLDGSFERIWPAKNVSSEEELKQFAKDEAWGHHASCTCPIGSDGDQMAVLDSEFKVRGTEGLRVVDASVFPKIPGMYIVLAIYMVSEKAADVIIAAAES